jgi:hypothetical protein
MAHYDWTLYTQGSYQINSVLSYSPSASLRNVSGLTRLFWSANSNLTNAGVTAQIKHNANFTTNNRIAFFLRLSYPGVYLPTEPVYNGYWMRCYVTNAGTGNVSFEFFRAKIGTGSTLIGVQNYLIPTAGTSWLKVRFSARDEFSMPVLRFEYWTGSAWITLYEYQDASASAVFSGGYAGWGFDRNDQASSLYFDDITISSFA